MKKKETSKLEKKKDVKVETKKVKSSKKREKIFLKKLENILRVFLKSLNELSGLQRMTW